MKPWLAFAVASLPAIGLLPAPALAQSAPAQPSIGVAEMDFNRTIWLRLTRPEEESNGQSLVTIPRLPPQEMIGYGDIELWPGDPHYLDVLDHLGGLEAGEIKPVPPWKPSEAWHCAIDPERGPCPGVHAVPS